MKTHLRLKAFLRSVVCVGLTGALAQVGGAQAALYLPGGAPLTGDLLTASLPGTIVATGSSGVDAGGYSGTTWVAVVDGPEAGANLDFYYQFTGRAPAGSVPALNLSLNLHSMPGTAGRTTLYAPGNPASGTSFENVTGFSASVDEAVPGSVGYLLRIRTAATAFQNAFGIATAPAVPAGPLNSPREADGSPLANIVSHTPEPGTLALFGASLLAMGGIARRRVS